VDLDFVLLPFPFFNAIHRVPTHNLFFVALLALAASLLVKKSRLIVALSVLAGATAHLFVDSIIDGNPSNGVDIALFWPLGDIMFWPFNLLMPNPDALGWENVSVGRVVQRLGPVLLLELPFYLGAVAVLIKKRSAQKRAENKPLQAGPLRAKNKAGNL